MQRMTKFLEHEKMLQNRKPKELPMWSNNTEHDQMLDIFVFSSPKWPVLPTVTQFESLRQCKKHTP